MLAGIVLAGFAGMMGARMWLRHAHYRRSGAFFGGPCGGNFSHRMGRHFGGHFGHHHHAPFDGGPSDDPGYTDYDDFTEGNRWGRGRRKANFWMGFLSARLDASPAQEKAMAEAVEEFQAKLDPLRDEAKKTRADLAAALRRPAFDEVLFGDLFSRHDDSMTQVRKAFMDLVGKVHDTLDEKQRDRLAVFIERGGGFFGRRRGW